MQPRRGNLLVPFTGLLNLLKENTVKADKSLKLSKLISRSSHAASAKSCFWKTFKYNYSKLNVVQELHCIVLSTADDLVHKSKADQLETLLKESFSLCHCQPHSSTSHDRSWTHPVHSSHNCISC